MWFSHFDESKYLGEGAEQKIYDYSDPNYIIKLNDSIFYEWWEDYFNSLLLHNYFFPSLAYELLGFYKIDTTLYAVVKQAFVKISEVTNLENVKVFLKVNGIACAICKHIGKPSQVSATPKACQRAYKCQPQ